MNSFQQYKVSIYCPDRHISYDGTTLDQRGVGGGITARLRLAQALATRGHDVSVICNCPRTLVHAQVKYLPLDAVKSLEADVLILHSTGDKLDFSPVLEMTVLAPIQIVFVDGVDAPKGLDKIPFDHLVAPSNFIRGLAILSWGVPEEKLFVSHHGVDRQLFSPGMLLKRPRQPKRIAYATHPSKGYDAAIGVLRLVRQQVPDFELHVYGGYGLWGQDDQFNENEPGVVYHGLMGQRDLALELTQSSFALYLQNRLEPFGIAITEAMAAGCITVASSVGAHSEIIENGRSGFLVAGDPGASETQVAASERILACHRNEAFGEYVRDNARHVPLDWGRIAETWEQHWNWLRADRKDSYICPGMNCSCGGALLLLADGYHCSRCGLYSRQQNQS